MDKWIIWGYHYFRKHPYQPSQSLLRAVQHEPQQTLGQMLTSPPDVSRRYAKWHWDQLETGNTTGGGGSHERRTMENWHDNGKKTLFWRYLLLKMVIFHCHVSIQVPKCFEKGHVFQIGRNYKFLKISRLLMIATLGGTTLFLFVLMAHWPSEPTESWLTG